MNRKAYLQSNSAGKLVSILEKIKESNPPSMQSLDGWAITFGVSKEQPIFVLNGLVDLHFLIHEVYSEMESVGYQEDIYQDVLLDLNKCIEKNSKNLSSSWSEIVGGASNGTISALKACAAELHKRPETQHIPLEELISIKNKIVELIQEINGSTLPNKVKTSLENALNGMHASIDRYSNFGGNHFAESYEAFIGRFTVTQIEYPIIEDKEIVPKIFKFLKIVSDTFKLAKQVILLTENLKGLIGLDIK